MKHLFIINPAAGSYDRTKIYTAQIDSVCRKRVLDYEIAVSQAPGDCRRLARAAAETGAEVRIYACGGDGTLNEIVQGAAGFGNAAVTVLAGGSGNDFVKIFSDPNAFRDVERLLDAETITLDLIACGEELALNICSVGLDARIAGDVALYKRTPLLQGFRAYAVSTVSNLLKRISEPYRIEIGGEVLQGPFTMVCACSGRWYGGGFCPVPEADPTDGILEVLVVKKVTLPQVPGLIGKYKDGKYRELPEFITHYRADRLRVHCEWDTSVNLDGEIRMLRDIDIRIAPEKIRFFFPKGLHL